MDWILFETENILCETTNKKTKQDTKLSTIDGREDEKRDIRSRLGRTLEYTRGTEQLMQLQVLGPVLASHRALKS